jgi:hypothetical protein
MHILIAFSRVGILHMRQGRVTTQQALGSRARNVGIGRGFSLGEHNVLVFYACGVLNGRVGEIPIMCVCGIP